MLKFLTSLSRKQKERILLTLDVLAVPIAIGLSFVIQSSSVDALGRFVEVVPMLPYLMVATAMASLWSGLPSVRLNAYENHAIGMSAMVAVLVAFATAVTFQIAGLAFVAGTYVIIGITYFLLTFASRIALQQLVTAVYRRSTPRCRVLIYGAGNTGAQLASALKTHESIDPVAFVDDNISLQGISLAGLAVHPPSRIAQLVEDLAIDRVLLAMPSASAPKQAQIVRKVERMGVEVQALPSFAQLIGQEALVDKLVPVAAQHFLGRQAQDGSLDDAAACYAGRNILISGAGGSIGSELCRQVLSCGPKRIVMMELCELALYTVDQELRQVLEGQDVELVPVLGSVTDARLVRRVMKANDVQVVLHAAAYKHVPLVEANLLTGLGNNVFGTRTLAREAAIRKVERFILVSSDKAVRPTNVMGASKRLAELVIQDLSSRYGETVFTMVRFGNVLGSSGSVVPLFQEQVARGGPVTVTDHRVKRYFMTIREAVQLVLKAGSEARGGEVFVLDMGEPVPIMQLARQVIESAGYTVQDTDNPDGDIAIEMVGLRPGEKIEEELSLSDNLIGTRYRKVFCVREGTLSEIEVASALKALRKAYAAGDNAAALDVVERWVEGYRHVEHDRKIS